MKTIAVLNLKGGVAKTTTATNLAYELSRISPTLLIDADKQGNSSEFFGQYHESVPAALGEALKAKRPEDCEKNGDILCSALSPGGTVYEGLDIMPSNTSLMRANISLLLDTGSGREKRLRKYLDYLQKDTWTSYAYCVIDCAPDIDMSSINALMASDLVLIPITLDKQARKGLAEVWEQIETSREGNPDLVARALITRYRPDQQDKLHEVDDLDLMRIRIRESTRRVEDSNDAGMPLSLYSKWSNAARDYRQLAREVMEVLG